MKILIATLTLATAVAGSALAFDSNNAHKTHPPKGGFMAADMNDDGHISKHEFLDFRAKKVESQFQKMDRDNDGQLSHDELKSARKNMKQKMQERMRTWQSQ